MHTEQLIQAISENRVEDVRHWIKTGMDVNETLDSENISPLHFAAQHPNGEIIELLLNAGANPLAKTRGGQTALSIAELYNNEIFLKLAAE